MPPKTRRAGTPTSPPALPRRWREKDARRVLKVWRQSGLPAGAFARSLGIDAQRLLWWRKRLGSTSDVRSAPAGAPPSPALTFIPATVVSPALGAAVTIRLPGGVCVEVQDPAAVPAIWIGGVAAELAKAGS